MVVTIVLSFVNKTTIWTDIRGLYSELVLVSKSTCNEMRCFAQEIMILIVVLS